jgi:hypothetical protein
MNESTQTVARREGLIFSSVDDVIADVQRLRRGSVKTGAWSLPQVCWHLEATTQLRMVPGPFPLDTPEQIARKAKLREIFATNKLPAGIEAPPPAIPPSDAGESAIDALIATLKRWDAYTDPIAPHRIFGHLSDADIRKLNLIHCAHHLSHLVPSS